MQVGDEVYFHIGPSIVSAVITWLPSNSSVHLKTDTHSYRINHRSLLEEDKVLGEDDYTVSCNVHMNFSDVQKVNLFYKWKEADTCLPLEEWIVDRIEKLSAL